MQHVNRDVKVCVWVPALMAWAENNTFASLRVAALCNRVSHRAVSCTTAALSECVFLLHLPAVTPCSLVQKSHTHLPTLCVEIADQTTEKAVNTRWPRVFPSRHLRIDQPSVSALLGPLLLFWHSQLSVHLYKHTSRDQHLHYCTLRLSHTAALFLGEGTLAAAFLPAHICSPTLSLLSNSGPRLSSRPQRRPFAS